MDDKKIPAGKALSDEELDSVVGGVHDEDIFRSEVRVACNSCRGSFSYIVCIAFIKLIKIESDVSKMPYPCSLYSCLATILPVS